VSARSREPHGPASGGPARGTVKRPKCAICGKPTSHDYRPYCSKRCADLDLGRWLKDAYAVPGEPVSSEGEEREDEK
jgi:endogenous inhibitor of DNA gyrase (YacG/DUF329 family)